MRLLTNSEWFDAVSSESQYESDFESIILSNASVVFPEYYAVPFRVYVESDWDIRIPDLALIDKHYRHWWVVEIEMAHHSLRRHVLPQVEVFASARYGLEHANYIIDQLPSSAPNPALVRDMVKGAQPRVLVVVNKNVPRWLDSIHRLDGLVVVVEVFRSSRNQHIFRINGDNIAAAEIQLVSRCRLDNIIPRLLQIDSPAALEVTHGERLSIVFHEGVTEWERTDISNRVWLSPVARNPLRAGQDYRIMRDDKGRLYFDEA